MSSRGRPDGLASVSASASIGSFAAPATDLNAGDLNTLQRGSRANRDNQCESNGSKSAAPAHGSDTALREVPVQFTPLERAQIQIEEGDEEAGVIALRDLAPSDPQACLLYAVALRHGFGTTSPEPLRALKLLLLPGMTEYPPALVQAAEWLSCSYHITAVRDTSVPKDDAVAVQLLDRALELDPEYSAAVFARGMAYMYGRGCPEDVRKAVSLLEKCARLDHVDSYCWLGRWYLFDISDTGKPKRKSADSERLARGLQYLRTAAARGSGDAHLHLAEFHRHALTTPSMARLLGALPKQRIEELAVEFDLKGAELGSPIGYLNVGEAFATGVGCRKADFDEARKYYELAWDAGVTSAADALGFLYEKGGGMEENLGLWPKRVNYKEAIRWYLSGSKVCNPAATLHLAEAYDDGIGVEVDLDYAEELYHSAIEFAEALSEVSIVGDAQEGLSRLYLARCKTAPHTRAEAMWKQKLEALVGVEEAKSRIRQVGRLLTRLSEHGPTSRRSKDVGASHLDSARSELFDLVGEGSGKRLLEAYNAP